MNKSVILFLTHKIRPEILAEFRRIKISCGDKLDVVLLYQDSQNDSREFMDIASTDDYLLNLEAFRDLAYPNWQDDHPRRYKERNVVPGNVDFLILKFFLDNPDYAYYWAIEYDVSFSGPWDLLIDSVMESDADLVTTTLRRYNDDPSWAWWFSLRPPSGQLDKSEMIACLAPISRLSNKACHLLDQMYRKGWRGHHEVIMPTLLDRHGFVLEDIGGVGEFVPSGHDNRFYVGWRPGQSFTPRAQTIRYRPIMLKPGRRRNTLWHPVKAKARIPTESWLWLRNLHELIISKYAFLLLRIPIIKRNWKRLLGEP